MNKVNVGSDHRMVRGRIELDLRRERNKLMMTKQLNLVAIRERVEEYQMEICSRYSLLENMEDEGIEEEYEIMAKILTESAFKVGGKKPTT